VRGNPIRKIFTENAGGLKEINCQFNLSTEVLGKCCKRLFLLDSNSPEAYVHNPSKCGVRVFFRFDRSINNQRLHRANSFIRARKERAGLSFINQDVIYASPRLKIRMFLALS